jgi:transposase
MPSKGPQMIRQGTASKRKHITLILQKIQIMWSLRSGKSQQEIMASYKIGSSTTDDVKKRKKLHLFMASCES